MTLERPKTCQTFPGLEGSAGRGHWGLGCSWGSACCPGQTGSALPLHSVNRLKIAMVCFLPSAAVILDGLCVSFFPPNGYISNIRPVQLHLGFFSWHYLVLADCKQSSSCALWPPESQLGVVGNTPGPTCTQNFKLEHFT